MFILPQFENIYWKIEAMKVLSDWLIYKKILAQTLVGARQGRKCVSIPEGVN